MPLETATYIGSLVSSNPASSDLKAQGDDHIRLVKASLLATFPNATKPFYFPTAAHSTATETIPASEHNKLKAVSAAAGPVVLTLPTLTAAQAGWSVDVVRTDNSSNILFIYPPSGTINGHVNVKLPQLGSFARFIWSGSSWYALISGNVGGLIGQIALWPAALPPDGWVVCDGQALSRTTYAMLFARIGTTFGTGDGSTTFNVPNLTGRTAVGIDTASVRTTGLTTIGAAVGAATHTLALGEITAHSHAGTTDSGGSHTHGFTEERLSTGSTTTGKILDSGGAVGGLNGSFTTDAGGTHTHTFATNSQGGGGAHNNMQPSLALTYMICSGI